MQSKYRLRSRALWARGQAALWAMLVVGLGTLAWPAEALARTGQPLAYVTNSLGNTVSVIDTRDNTVIATVPVGYYPYGIAVTPDGKYVYVANCGGQSETLSVIATAGNTVVGNPIPVGGCPVGIAVTPDGKYIYVANNSNYVSVIATAGNTVVGNRIPVGASPNGSLSGQTGDTSMSRIAPATAFRWSRRPTIR